MQLLSIWVLKIKQNPNFLKLTDQTDKLQELNISILGICFILRHFSFSLTGKFVQVFVVLNVLISQKDNEALILYLLFPIHNNLRFRVGLYYLTLLAL